MQPFNAIQLFSSTMPTTVLLFITTLLLYDAEIATSQGFLPFSNKTSLVADKSRFVLPQNSQFANQTSSLARNLNPFAVDSTNSFGSAVNEETPLQRETRQFVYDTNPWSSGGSSDNNLISTNSNSRSNSRTSSSNMPGDVRRPDNTRRNGANSRSSAPSASPWDTDNANSEFEGSGSSYTPQKQQQSNVPYKAYNNNYSNSRASSGAAAANTGDGNQQWPPTSASDNQQSVYGRNNQQYPSAAASSSQIRPSASSHSPQPTSPWGGAATRDQHTRSGGASTGGSSSSGTGGNAPEDDEDDDEWDNVEGSGDSSHATETDPFGTGATGADRPTSSSASGYNLVGQPPSAQNNNNWQLPPSNSRPAAAETANRQPPVADFDTSGGSRTAHQPPYDSRSLPSGQYHPPSSSYEDPTSSNYHHDNFQDRNNNNDNTHPEWPYDESPSSSSSTTLPPGLALPPAVGAGASGGGVTTNSNADEANGEDEDSTIKPVEIPTNTVYRGGNEGTTKNNNGIEAGRPFSPSRPNMTSDLGGVSTNVTGLTPSSTTETPEPPSWAWFSAMALQFFDSFYQKMSEEPGLLAAVIGGAVIGLLCAILLAMFLIYRMRKKDEGSYALDESTVYRKPGGYMRAPTSEITAKEYYA